MEAFGIVAEEARSTDKGRTCVHRSEADGAS